MLWTPFLFRLWWAQSTSLNPAVKYKLQEEADRDRAKHLVTTLESQAESSGVIWGGFVFLNRSLHPPG